MKEFGFGFGRDHRYVTTVVKYRNCVVDFGPSRAVHHPDLNACFLKNNLDCNAIHFGYAIPVIVLLSSENSDVAELVFDTSQDLDPVVAGYLLEHHPDFKFIRSGIDPVTLLEDHAICELKKNFLEFTEQFIQDEKQENKEMKKMTTTAKHEQMRNFTEPEEDIAAIAKQISDHAEAIYQTWKSRGLAPTEILTCHGNSTAADKFGSTLTPKIINSGMTQKSKTPPEVLADANKLEKLVNNFVVEDKARLAASKNFRPSPKSNTIQYALQKFEKNLNTTKDDNSVQSKPSGMEYPYRVFPQPTQISRPVPANQIQLSSLDTIEVMLPKEVVRSNSPTLQKFIGPTESSGSNSTTKGLATWPLKNKTISQDNMKMRKDSLKTSLKNSEEYLNEVQREEEKLINALKCGVIINDESAEKGDITGTSNLGLGKDVLVSGMKNSTTDSDGAVKMSESPLRAFAKNRCKNSEEPRVSTQSQSINLARTRFESVKKVQEHTFKDNYVKEWVTEENGPQNKVKVNSTLKNRHWVSENVPHPELTNQQKQHIRQTGTNPIRPFLTRGSVAERVLIFEKCPTELLLEKRRTEGAVSNWRSGADPSLKPQTYVKEKEKENQRPSKPLHTTLQRQAKANKNVYIPRFYFPQGKPQNQQQIDIILQKLAADFRTFPLGQVPREKFHIIVKSCDCPLFWKVPLFQAAGGEKLGYVEAHSFLEFWKQLATTCYDAAAKFLKILVRNETRNFLLPEDFIPLVQDVVDTHSGLVFLKEANEFHSRYVHTVIARIFYCVNRSWSGRITLPELRRSNLLHIISLLEEEEDINQITQYFSYEHFYVIYCKFWELDRDHDLFIDRQDLTRHNDHALSSRMIDRIFSGAVTRGSSKINHDKMSYTEFVWFLLSEEDKQHPTAIEYWFRCMDLDGDGYLSMYELEYFYEEQLQRMELLGIATLPFEDCLCQMLDMIHPQVEGKISLADLKRCKMVTIFFDTFFNLEKYLDHEQRDPFASQRDHDVDGEISDWDRYAAEEYEILVAEEEGNDHCDDLSYDSDEIANGLPNLDKLIKTFVGVDSVSLPCSGNLKFGTIDSDISLSNIFGTNIDANKNGSIRIKVPGEEEKTICNGRWDSTPKVKLTKCEEFVENGNQTPKTDNRIVSA